MHQPECATHVLAVISKEKADSIKQTVTLHPGDTLIYPGKTGERHYIVQPEQTVRNYISVVHPSEFQIREHLSTNYFGILYQGVLHLMTVHQQS